jgi:hypothetical protein
MKRKHEHADASRLKWEEICGLLGSILISSALAPTLTMMASHPNPGFLFTFSSLTLIGVILVMVYIMKHS